MRSSAIFVLGLFFLAGCGELKTPTSPGGGGEPIDTTATLTRVQSEVFTPTCANIGCHDTIGQQGGLVLTSGRSYVNTVGVASTQMPQLARVAVGNPDNSYLYRKLTGAGITGERMPLGMTLPADKLKLVRDWIRRGAPND